MSLRVTALIVSPLAALAIGCGKKPAPAQADAAPAPAADTAAPTPEADTAQPPAPQADAAPAQADTAAAPQADAAPAQADAGATADAAAPQADAGAVAADAGAAPAGPTPTFKAEGFSTPESVLVAGDVYYVSNIEGKPLDKDDNGFISKLGADGKITELKWIDGAKAEVELNAPKGMGVIDGVLYVADIDVVRKFDAATGEAKGSIAIPGATFLNDVAVMGSVLYVSDSGIGADFKPAGTPAIWAITSEEVPTKLEIDKIGLPNGVFAESAEAGAVVFFNGFDDAKAIVRFNAADKTTSTIAVPGGSLDGLAVVREEGKPVSFFVSSWETGSVYQIDEQGQAKVIASGIKGPADFGVDLAKRLVIVPVFMENRVEAYAF